VAVDRSGGEEETFDGLLSQSFTMGAMGTGRSLFSSKKPKAVACTYADLVGTTERWRKRDEEINEGGSASEVSLDAQAS